MAYSLVAHVSATCTATTTTSAINTTGADFIVIGISKYANAAAVTLSDSKGNTYTALTEQANTVPDARIYYVEAPTVGSGHTFTVTEGAGDCYGAIFVQAWSGSAASPFDVQNGVVTGSIVSSGQPGSITPNQNGELIIFMMGSSDNIVTPYTMDNSFTQPDPGISWASGVTEGGGMGYLVQSTAAAINPTAGWGGTNTFGVALVIASFKAAASGIVIAVSESGSAADTVAETMTAAVAVSESGSAADAETVSARIADAEAGAAVDTIGETMTAPISVAGAGAASDTISETMTALISVSEAGTALDTITAILSAFAIGVSENGSAADTISEVMTALISVSEAGAALDTITVALAGTFFIGVSESGAAADSFTITGGVQPTPPVGPTAGFDAGPGIGRWFNLAFKAGSGRRRVREGLGAEIEALASPEAAETAEEVVSAAIEALAETEIAAENDALERIWEHEARYAELIGERESLYASTQAFIQAVEAAAREELARRERAVVQRREDAEMVVILMALG